MANEGIKEKAIAIGEHTKTTAEQVSKTFKDAVPVYKGKVSQKIYVGPNLLGLPKYTVVESIKVPHIQTFIKDCSEIEKLFVAIDAMAETEVRIQQKGTLEHRYYNKVFDFFRIGKGDQ